MMEKQASGASNRRMRRRYPSLPIDESVFLCVSGCALVITEIRRKEGGTKWDPSRFNWVNDYVAAATFRDMNGNIR